MGCFRLLKKHIRKKKIVVTSEDTITRIIAPVSSSVRRKISSSKSFGKSFVIGYGRCELDSHADTIVARRNCVVLGYSGQEYDVSLYRDDYQSMTNIPVAQVATTCQSDEMGQTYIIVFNESLWMGDSMSHTLVNPNQLRHYGVRVQDDPTSRRPLSIIKEDASFSILLKMKGMFVYMDTHTFRE